MSRAERISGTMNARRTQDDLGGAVVPGRDDAGVVVVLEGRTAEVDEPDVGVLEDALRLGLILGGRLR
jgi:hypothetical protein